MNKTSAADFKKKPTPNGVGFLDCVGSKDEAV